MNPNRNHPLHNRKTLLTKEERQEKIIKKQRKVEANKVEATEKMKKLLEKLLNYFYHQNELLIYAQNELKRLQPKNSNSIILELYGCGKSCAGCPHPRWMKYVWKTAPNGIISMRGINISKTKSDPSLLLKKTEPHYHELLKIIKIAKNAMIEKNKILNLLKPLWPIVRIKK